MTIDVKNNRLKVFISIRFDKFTKPSFMEHLQIVPKPYAKTAISVPKRVPKSTCRKHTFYIIL